MSKDEKSKFEDRVVANDNAFRYSQELDNTQRNRDTLFTILFQYYKLKDWKNFDKLSKNLLLKSISSNDSLNLVKVYRYKAGKFKNTGVFDSSYYYYQKAEKIYFKLNDKLNYATVLLNKGIVQSIASDFLGAELSLIKAYSIFKMSDENQQLFETLNQLGVVYIELKEYENAVEYHNKALNVAKMIDAKNNVNLQAISLNNIGFIYQSQKKYRKAISNYQKALIDKNLINENPELYANLIDNLAYSKLKIEDYSELPDMFFLALKTRDTLKLFSSLVVSNLHLSEYYQKRNDSLSSKKYGELALKAARTSKNPVDLIIALRQLSLTDKKNSVKLSAEYTKLSDSLQIAERNSKDRFARIQLETDELRQENFNLLEKNRNILSYFFGTVFFIGVLFLMKNQRSRARLLALKQAQQQANEEIYRLIISHQNQLELGKDLEKKRLSKELHDGVLGRLFGLRLSLDGLNSFDDEQAKKERLEYLNELQLIEQDLREISHELSRETSLLINNFVAIINSLIEQQAKVNNANIKVIISENIDWDKISNIIKINLYRILQEALQNINKHAGAKNVLVHFRKDTEENLLFNIEDDGKGFDTNIKKNKGIGTKNMVSRVHQCNGSIDIKSEIGKGSKIIIIFPLENSNFKV
ncbi:MAG TPA: sensor histidine kinase [Flavobacterium sp.]|nr:sensor histidine kinase [Flavobacterium sp.]